MFFSLLLVVVNLAVLLSFSSFASVFSFRKESVFLAIGVIVFIAVYLKFSSIFDKPYILAHELSHAMAGFLRGNKIRKIKIGSKSGYVVFSSRTDFWTSMAPYILPFYSIVLAGIYFAISFFFDMERWRPIFLSTQGFLISFHTISTLSVMGSGVQNDFKKTKSVFLSYMLVIFINMISLAIFIKIIFPGSINLTLFLKKSFENFLSISRFSVFYARKLYLVMKELK